MAAFNFGTNMHSVQKVPKEAFEVCDGHNTTHYVITTGPTTLKLDTAGMHYFICTVGNHCFEGQKLAVNVTVTVVPPIDNAMSPSSNAAQPPPTRTPPASHGDACSSTPANSLSSSPPICDGSSSALTPSSSTLLMATLYVTLYAFVL